MRNNKRKNGLKIKLTISIIIIAVWLVSLLFAGKINKFLQKESVIVSHLVTAEEIESSDYYVSYINVGQGNSCFIRLPDQKTVLIDGGDVEYGETVGNFLNNHNVSTIDYMIATHADSDHIGGLNYVLENFEVRNIYRPFEICGSGNSTDDFTPETYEDLGEVYNHYVLTSGNKHKISRITTSVYKKFIKKVYDETYLSGEETAQASVTVFYDGLKIVGDDYKIEFFGPLVREENLDLSSMTTRTDGFATVGYGVSNVNDNSAILVATVHDDSYLFTGDSTFYSSSITSQSGGEFDFLNSLTPEEKTAFANISVFMLGHHGSRYSSNPELIELIQPKYIVVSSGNKYGHPHEETLERLKSIDSLQGDYLLRTDTNGTIEFSGIDGALAYSLETPNGETSIYFVRYEVLSSVVVVSLIVFIFSIKKPKRRRR